MIWPGWDRQILGALGVEPTKARLAFLNAWAACEGGRAAWNPLNTTYRIEGATDYNSAHVKNYRDPIEGVCCTLLTMRLASYRHLVAALRHDGWTATQILAASRHDITTWGTSPDCIAARLR